MVMVSRLFAVFLLGVVALAGCQSEGPAPTATPGAVIDPGQINGPAQRLVDMALVHPRPDAETGNHAQHRNAYPGIAWSTHVVIMGGAYPFRFELLQAPAGMTIGNDSGANYGVIHWPDPQVGSYTVRARVFDQDRYRSASASQPLDLSFTLTVSANRFVFIDPIHGQDSNPGTLQAPLRRIAALHQGDSNQALFSGKNVYLRAGTHPLDGMSTNFNNYAMFEGKAPNVFIGYPGETAVLSLYQGSFRGRTATDFMLKDLTIEHANADGVDQRYFAGVEAQQRNSFHRVVFRDYKMGTTEGENPSMVFYYSGGAGSSPHQHVSFHHCEFTGGMGAISTTYGVEHFSFQHNRLHHLNTTGNYSPTNGWGLLYFKDSTRDVDVRANHAWEGITAPLFTSFVGVGGQNNTESDYAYDRIRISYNFIKGFEHAYFGTYDGGSAATGTIDGFRNSIDGLVAEYIHTHPPQRSRWVDNVVTQGFDNMSLAFTSSGNVTGAGVLNANMALEGAARSLYLGSVGAELVSTMGE